MLSNEALNALTELDAGARMNCLHTVARELIAAGMAFDGWGYLEITESGRRLARSALPYRNFAISDPNIANMGDRNAPPIVPEEIVTPKPEIVSRQEPVMTWSRERAVKAAGVANGRVGIWVDQRWVEAFLQAYETHS
jgi:hypothetical protein